MKIDIKNILCKSIMALMVIPFFLVNSVPVFADYDIDTYRVEAYEVVAYEYWNHVGYNLTQSFSNSTNIAVPAYYTENGNSNYQLICNEPNYTGQENDYACYYRNSSNGQIMGTWSRSTNVAHTEVEQNISIQGSEVPWLSGTYIHDNNFSWDRSIFLQAKETVYFSFISTVNVYTGLQSSDAVSNNYLRAYSDNGATGFEVSLITQSVAYGVYYKTFAIYNPNTRYAYLTINFPAISNDTKIIPVYIGNGNDLNDSVKQQLGITTTTENALNNISSKIDGMYTNLDTVARTSMSTNNSLISGNATSQAAQSVLNNSNTTLNNRVDQMNSIETEYNSDLNAALDDIDLSTDLVQHTGFTNAALWVSAQFNRLVVGTPIELVVTFSLITGLALVLIGKVRG